MGTKRQLAAMLNLSERRITDLMTAKILPPRGAKGFDLVASVRGYVAFLKTEPNTLRTERLRLAKVKADLLELQLQQRQGELIDLSLIRCGLEGVIVNQRTMLLGLSAQIGRDLDDPEIRVRVVQLVDRRVREVLEVLAAYDPVIEPHDDQDGTGDKEA